MYWFKLVHQCILGGVAAMFSARNADLILYNVCFVRTICFSVSSMFVALFPCAEASC
jgi:hypothetical protein